MLAIGIVVDDAIVVVENVERNIEAGLSPRDATYRAMREVSGPIIAIALVLVRGLRAARLHQRAHRAVLPPVRPHDRDLDGDLGGELADALAGARGAAAQGPRRARRTASRARWTGRSAGFFHGFNRLFGRGIHAYSGSLGRVLSRRRSRMLGIYAVLVVATVGLFRAVPGGFVPGQDKQYLIGFAQLPDGATLDRTEDVIRRMGDIALKHPGVEARGRLPGPVDQRLHQQLECRHRVRDAEALRRAPREGPERRRHRGPAEPAVRAIHDAFIAIFPPPPVQGLGTTGGFKLQIEDRASLGYAALDAATKDFLGKAYKSPELAGLFSSFQVNVPQLNADIDRTKARQLGVPVTEVFDTMQIYLGSLYVNDFSRFGRTYSVRVQADAPFRARPEDVGALKVRADTGEMVPLSALLAVQPAAGPERAMRYNGFLAADVNGRAAPGYSSGQAQDAIARIAAETLPPGICLRVDRAHLPGDPRGQLDGAGVPALDPAGVPGAGGALREPHAAAVDHPHRADGAARGDDGRVAHARRQQHLHADRARSCSWACRPRTRS